MEKWFFYLSNISIDYINLKKIKINNKILNIDKIPNQI